MPIPHKLESSSYQWGQVKMKLCDKLKAFLSGVRHQEWSRYKATGPDFYAGSGIGEIKTVRTKRAKCRHEDWEQEWREHGNCQRCGAISDDLNRVGWCPRCELENDFPNRILRHYGGCN